MASVIDLAAHLFDLHEFMPSEALAEARRRIQGGEGPRCPLCESWLRRQLEGLDQKGRA